MVSLLSPFVKFTRHSRICALVVPGAMPKKYKENPHRDCLVVAGNNKLLVFPFDLFLQHVHHCDVYDGEVVPYYRRTWNTSASFCVHSIDDPQ